MTYYNPYYYTQYPYNNSYQNQSYNIKSMEWVSGEVGAKAFAQPNGWPPETPIVLWDSTEKKIFLKSWNGMGAPNPIQELDYEIRERTNPALLPDNISGAAHDMSQYVTRQDFEELRKEIRNMTTRSNRDTRGETK